MRAGRKCQTMTTTLFPRIRHSPAAHKVYIRSHFLSNILHFLFHGILRGTPATT